MNYRQLQKILKPLKVQGLTNVKRYASESVLRAEFERLVNAGAITPGTNCHPPGSTQRSPNAAIGSKCSASSVALNQHLSDCDEEIELDPEIEALVAESWTDKPELAIATIAAYSVAGLAIVVLWIALITTTLVISGLKCWYWCWKQFTDLTLQLKYFEPPIELPVLSAPQLELFIPIQPLLVH